MANEEHLKILKQGVKVWNKWRERNPLVNPNLDGVNLSKSQLNGVNFSDVNLSTANLEEADISGADLRWAKLYDANLSGANLSGANALRVDLYVANLSGANLSDMDFSGANLVSANLSNVNLCGTDLTMTNLTLANLTDANLSKAKLNVANLHGADLTRANLTEANIIETAFICVCLKDVKGLVECCFNGPSTIDYRTIQVSGFLPIEFLRGCGLPDPIIKFYHGLVDQTYYSCFISYSVKDREFANKLWNDLQRNDIRCWFAEHDIQSGKKVHEQIGEAIQRHDRLLLILSEHSMNSEWVKTEIANARERENKEDKQILFPIGLADFELIRNWKCFDSDTGKDSAREIREYFIPDFQNWTDDNAYYKSLARLLRDIKAQPSTG